MASPTDHVRLELSSNFTGLAARYRGKNHLTSLTIGKVTKDSASEQVKLAKLFLTRLVYDAPSGTWDRTRRLFNSVKEKRITETSHEAIVDHTDFPSYMYAFTIEGGSSHWMWWGHAASRPFRARPFWAPAKQLSETFARLEARAALRLIKMEHLR